VHFAEPGPRVVIDPGSHAVLNVGDVSMLQVCLRRLRELWPEVVPQVLTSQPEALWRACPDAVPLAAAGRYVWFREPGAPPRAVSGARLRLAGAAARLRSRLPRLARPLLRAERALAGLRRGPAGELLDALLAADLVLVAGRGGLSDAFRDDALAVLGLLELAADLGIPTAMVGQGVGPATDPVLVARARQVLPRLGLIAVRERLFAPALLERLGVDGDRVVVTGDDAVEPALAAWRDGAPGDRLGVSLRFSSYYDIDGQDAGRLSEALERARREMGARFVPLPISHNAHEADIDAIAAITGVDGRAPWLEETIRGAGSCRAVVSATYHAAVFALSQGVPSVGLARSAYQEWKLRGLADQFGAGCSVLSLQDPDFAERLIEELLRAWGEAPSLREPLLEAARRQVETGRLAYRGLPGLLTG
jgi:polysaccharide pyruvyl transferase WcaK-like protein